MFLSDKEYNGLFRVMVDKIREDILHIVVTPSRLKNIPKRRVYIQDFLRLAANNQQDRQNIEQRLLHRWKFLPGMVDIQSAPSGH